MTKTLFW